MKEALPVTLSLPGMHISGKGIGLQVRVSDSNFSGKHKKMGLLEEIRYTKSKYKYNTYRAKEWDCSYGLVTPPLRKNYKNMSLLEELDIF